MVEMEIPSIDPIQHEAKFFKGFTLRQVLLLVPGIGLGVLCASKLWGVSMDLAVLAVMVCCIPSCFFAFYRPYNMKLEKYLMIMYENHFLNPQKRVYSMGGGTEATRVPVQAKKLKKAVPSKKGKTKKDMGD